MDCKYIFEYLENLNLIEDETIEEPIDGIESVNDIDKMKELMKTWANSSERSA